MYKQICDPYILDTKRHPKVQIQIQQNLMKDTKSNYREMFNNLSNTPKRNVNDKVMIVDGLNLFIRCFGAVPTLNDDGEHFSDQQSVILALIRKNKPTRVLVVFDERVHIVERKCIVVTKKVGRINKGK